MGAETLRTSAIPIEARDLLFSNVVRAYPRFCSPGLLSLAPHENRPVRRQPGHFRFLLSICATRAFTSFFTSALGSGLSVGK